MRALFAADPGRSRGRLHAEPGTATRGPRDAFQRDRDRIIHATAFRRLRHKTQVFVAPDGDYFRVRLTHSLEVAQIARTIARSLGLNEDLTEALALAHDIGHPPFGHAGEEALTAAMADVGGFDHNAHTIRALTLIEAPYPNFDGLNLSWETLEGLAKHNGPVRAPTWALAEYNALHPLGLDSYPSLEAQIAALADDIAYDNHDIDDGLRAGLLDLEELIEQPFARANWDVAKARYPDAPVRKLVMEMVREGIGRMVNDVLGETRARLAEAGPRSADDVRRAGRPLAGFSAELAPAERALKRFLYANLYRHPKVMEIAEPAQQVVARLAETYRAAPERMPASWFETLPAQEPARGRHIGDFIAGMTDRYALRQYEALFGPSELSGF